MNKEELQQRLAAAEEYSRALAAELEETNKGLMAITLELEKMRQLERHLAYHDSLTSLPNRELFYDRLNNAVARAKRNGHKVAVLFLDLDDFKQINDSFGHDIGDQLLKSVAQRLQDSIRECDAVARLGGDEFTILLDQIPRMQDAASVAKKIQNTVSSPFILDGNELNIAISIGISLYPNDGQDAEILIKHADAAMYRVKSEDTNCCRFYDEARKAGAANGSDLENELRIAIENGELELHYQPQVDLRTKQIIGVEALVRWQHPDHGFLPPSEFISLAEETGLIVPLGEWVLNTGCEQNKAWQMSGLPPIRLAINLSARQFRVLRLQETVNQVLQKTGLNPSLLVLELTESSAMQNVEVTIMTLNNLRDMGVRIAMDDFGTGYASLNYLKRFPIDILKIDRSFVNGLHSNQDDWAIISAIVAMTHSLKLKVLAEGVEKEEQLTYLRSLKCDEFQGFYFSRPLPVDACTELLQSQAAT